MTRKPLKFLRSSFDLLCQGLLCVECPLFPFERIAQVRGFVQEARRLRQILFDLLEPLLLLEDFRAELLLWSSANNGIC